MLPQFLGFTGSQWVNKLVDYSELSGVPAEFTPSPHTHVKADITDFSDDDYAAAVHTHPTGEITDLDTGVAGAEMLYWNIISGRYQRVDNPQVGFEQAVEEAIATVQATDQDVGHAAIQSTISGSVTLTNSW